MQVKELKQKVVAMNADNNTTTEELSAGKELSEPFKPKEMFQKQKKQDSMAAGRGYKFEILFYNLTN